ncbi:CoA transferase [Pusillimonas sp. TS35]|nr:CoA transferase [Pusillimonas sp. TS35]
MIMSCEGTVALAGVRVLDLSRVLAGPWCTQNLADLGAEVIKVERPGTGDDTRAWGPPWQPAYAHTEQRDAAYFSIANRGKKSLALDIASAQGQAVVRDLAKQSQILVENFKVGDLARYGLDYASLKAINPALVYCSITGYGQSGPHAAKPGYDFIFQGIGGIMSVTGHCDGEPGSGPMRSGLSIVDVMTGMYATVAVLGALRHAERTGMGQHVDISLLDCVVAAGANHVTNLVITGEVPYRHGNAHPVMVPYNVFATADSHIVVAAGNDRQWRTYCKAIDRPELGNHPRFRTGSGRLEHRGELVPILDMQMRTRTTADWIERLEQAGIPCGPINDYRDVLNHPQVKHRELQWAIAREDGTACPTVRSPLRMSETPVSYTHAPPRLGEHNQEILQGILGWPEAEANALTDNLIL